MPPKRTSSSKRKLISDSEDDAIAASSSSSKKAKVSPSNTSENMLSSNGQPTNKVLPVNISFPARHSGTIIRLATFNVCGLAASQKKVGCLCVATVNALIPTWKGFNFYCMCHWIVARHICCWTGGDFAVEAEDPDILVLTETKVSILKSVWFPLAQGFKVNKEPVDLALKNRFPHCYWSIAEKKGYCEQIECHWASWLSTVVSAGTAILTKHKALSVDRTLPGHPTPSSVKGRIVTLEFENHYVVGTYVPNAGTELKVCLVASIYECSGWTSFCRISARRTNGTSTLPSTSVILTNWSL